MIKLIDKTNNINVKLKDKINKNICSKNKQDKKKDKNKLTLALCTLGIIGAVGLSIATKSKSSRTITLSDIKFDKGLATLKKSGQKYTGTIIHKTKDNATISLTYLDSVLQESKKVNSDNTIEFIKKYTTDANKKITSIFKQKDDGSIEKVRTLIRGNDSIRINGQNGVIEKYFHKADGKWHCLDDFIDKTKQNERWLPINKWNTGNFYLHAGIDINKFLRRGEFSNYQFTDKKIPLTIPDDLPDSYREYFESLIKEAKAYNRAIIDYIEPLDDFAKSFTLEKPITVYRDTYTSWFNKAKNGILTDSAFVSTSLEKGASMEGLIGSNASKKTTYKIHLPIGTKCANLSYTTEKELLLPRNSQFKVIGPFELEYILPKE